MDKFQLHKLEELFELVLNAKDIYEAIHKSADLVKELIDVDRVSIFIKENDRLWTLRADYTEKFEMPLKKGIVGFVAAEKKAYMTNDAYKDVHFAREIDLKTAYNTKNILAAPIIDTAGKLIGVVEFINKNGDFNDKDLVFAEMYAKYISEPLKFHLGIV
ncbi:GAF domain-containing protein [Nautilia sp.]